MTRIQGQAQGHGRRLFSLTLGALGIVYGDIGTSPLYAMRECFYGPHAVSPTTANVLGVLSVICWALILIISVKYLVFVMRADNRGEGGILALLALIRQRWGWGWLLTGVLMAFFLSLDLAFFGANLIKIPHGGWFPLIVAAAVFTLMTTWRQGRHLLAQRLETGARPIQGLLQDVRVHPPQRVPGTAVFMSRSLDRTPAALLLNLRHNKVLHERVVLLTVVTADIPHVPIAERLALATPGDALYGLVIHYGFMDTPDVPAALTQTKALGLLLQPEETTYFLGRETLFATAKPGMALWREQLFALMTRNARSATDFFRLPPDRVLELGAQIEL